MNLQIYLDIKGQIIKIEPSEEFSMKLGDEIIFNEKYYSVMKIDVEEFPEYELIVNKIELNELEESNVLL